MRGIRLTRAPVMVLLVALALALVACGSQPAGQGQASAPAKPSAGAKLEKLAVKVGPATPFMPFMPLYVADKKGFWKDEGLIVEIVQFFGGKAHQQAMLANTLEFSLSGSTDILDAKASDLDLVAFFSQSNAPDYKWVVRKGFNKDQLKGAKVGTTAVGTFPYAVSVWALNKMGVQEKDVQWVRTGSAADRMKALIAGQIDVAALSALEAYTLEAEGYQSVINLQDFYDDFQLEVFIAQRAFLKKNPEVTRAFLRGYIKGVQFTRKSPEEATALGMQALGGSAEHKKFWEQAVKYHIPFWREDGRFANKMLEEWIDIDVKAGKLKQKPAVGDLFVSDFVDYFKQNPVK